MLNRDEITAMVTGLQRVVGAQIQKIREPDDVTVCLYLRIPGETVRLVVSADPPRVAVSPEAVTTLPEPSTLGRWLRSVASGRRLVDLRQRPGDRVVILDFGSGRLVAELTGRTANLYGVDDAGRIVATARRPGRGARDLRPGRPYVEPEGEAPSRPVRWTDPVEVEAEAQRRIAAAKSDPAARARLVSRTRKRLQRLRKKVAADVARTEEADRWQRLGELLSAQTHVAQKGDAEALVQDWYAEGAPTVAIPLDPALDPRANADRYFARYKKAKAGAAKAAERLAEVDAALATLDAIAAEDLDVQRLEARLTTAGLHRARAAGGRRQATEERLPFRPYQSRVGELIRVGRGGADNHATTFHHARGNDHWLHVRDAAGAHVIVPEPRRGQAPHLETLRDAAALAVHHSKLRGEPGVEVMLTQRKNVRAVSGAGPGRVTVAAAKSISVADQAERIARLETRRT